jgi:hypothetical protein
MQQDAEKILKTEDEEITVGREVRRCSVICRTTRDSLR